MSVATGCLGPLFYFLLALLPILFKWAEAPRFVAWSWWQATALLWVPAGLFALLGLVCLLLDLLGGQRKRGW